MKDTDERKIKEDLKNSNKPNQYIYISKFPETHTRTHAHTKCCHTPMKIYDLPDSTDNLNAAVNCNLNLNDLNVSPVSRGY